MRSWPFRVSPQCSSLHSVFRSVFLRRFGKVSGLWFVAAVEEAGEWAQTQEACTEPTSEHSGLPWPTLCVVFSTLPSAWRWAKCLPQSPIHSQVLDRWCYHTPQKVKKSNPSKSRPICIERLSPTPYPLTAQQMLPEFTLCTQHCAHSTGGGRKDTNAANPKPWVWPGAS